MSVFGDYYGVYFGQYFGALQPVHTFGNYGFNYQKRKNRDIIEEVFSEIREAVEKEEQIPAAEIKRLLPVFGQTRFDEIQQNIQVINKRIEDQILYDQLSQERADLRRLVFIIENSLMQEMRLMQEDDEIVCILYS